MALSRAVGAASPVPASVRAGWVASQLREHDECIHAHSSVGSARVLRGLTLGSQPGSSF